MEIDFSTHLYFVISCQNYVKLYEHNIDISASGKEKIEDKEVIIVQNENILYLDVKELNDSFRNKNIYLFRLKIKSKSIIGESSIKITLKFGNNNLISKNYVSIKKDKKHLFIYNLFFEGKNIFDWGPLRNDWVNEFVNNKFNIIKAQKFLIFKEYIEKHDQNIMDYLLSNTAYEINNNSKEIVNFEFVLLFLINLLNFENNFSNLKEGKKLLFKSILEKFIEIKKVDIKKYNNSEYRKIIETIEKYRKYLEENQLLNLNVIILLYYKINKSDEFKKCFNEIKSKKKEVIDYIFKHHLIFSKFNFSEMELIYKSGNIKLANILNLSLNFNDYIQFFCIYGKEKSEEVIDLKKCPSPDENYSLRYLSKFIDIVIKNEKLYFPYEKFI